MKNQFIAVISLLSLVYAHPIWAAPIEFDRFLGQRTYNGLGHKIPGAFGGSGGLSERNLGMTLGAFRQMIKERQDNGDIHVNESLIKTPNKNYRLIVYAYGSVPAHAKAMGYIFDSDRIVGYCMLDRLQIYREDAAHIWYHQVTALSPVNIVGLSVPAGMELKTYQKRENGFIERYTFIERPRLGFDGGYLPPNITRTKELFMDAYYPEALDDYLVKYFILGELQAYLDFLKAY